MTLARTMLTASLMCRPVIALRASSMARFAGRAGAHFSAKRKFSCVSVPAAVDAVPTLTERFVVDNPEIVKQALEMRRAPPEQLATVDRIGELTRERGKAVHELCSERAKRKGLTSKIFALLKDGEQGEVDALKQEGTKIAQVLDETEARIEVMEAERSALFDTLPNLLDKRTHDGNDEDANIEVASWGCEGKLQSGSQWHDEIATDLGVLDMAAGAKLSVSLVIAM